MKIVFCGVNRAYIHGMFFFIGNPRILDETKIAICDILLDDLKRSRSSYMIYPEEFITEDEEEDRYGYIP